MNIAIETVKLAISDLEVLIEDGTVENNEFNKGRLNALNSIGALLVAIYDNTSEK